MIWIFSFEDELEKQPLIYNTSILSGKGKIGGIDLHSKHFLGEKFVEAFILGSQHGLITFIFGGMIMLHGMMGPFWYKR